MSVDSKEQPPRPQRAAPRLGPLDVLLLSIACGLAAGELEVAARIARRSLSSTDQLYLITRHFLWLAPLVDLALFLGFGALLAAATWRRPRFMGWLATRLVLGFAFLPALLEAGRGIYPEAWLILAMGLASCLAPLLERRQAGLWRWSALACAVLAAMVLCQAGWIAAGDKIAQACEDDRPLPPADEPNVLLVVLDTVRADRLSLNGYDRPTSPNLARLAGRGVRFDQARSAAPWTLASHATLFTGRWPHELGVKWMHPLREAAPTLAEFLARRGYATAGFVGNTFYCSYDSGLNRGFTHYQDHVLDWSSAVRSAGLVELSLKTLAAIAPYLPVPRFELIKLARGDRKGAHVVNREFLAWLSSRQRSQRPFFAFLNYVDAHAPYVLPPGVGSRFGLAPQSETDVLFLAEAWQAVDKTRLPPQALALGRDSYDNCLAFVDEQLGKLLDELERGGVLDQTLVIVTADHGEGLGEHDLFDHGESLYRTEIRVPLVIAPPGGRGEAQAVVDPFVSLRDLPATIAELVGAGRAHPFPGQSLSRFWTAPAGSSPPGEPAVRSELAAPNPIDPNQGRSPAARGPLVALAQGDYVYIRNEGDGGEQLFHERDDPRELTNRASTPALLPILERFRAAVRSSAPDPPTLPRTRPASPTRPAILLKSN